MSKKVNASYSAINICFLFLLIMPLILLILWSFAKNWTWPYLYPNSFGVRGWEYFFSGASGSVEVLFKSIILSLGVTAVSILISIPAGKALGLYEFKGKKWIEILIFAPIIVSPVSIAMGIHVAFLKLGLANTYLGVGLVQLIPCLPYAIRIIQNVFEIVGDELEEQAKVLGANSLQVFFFVTWPQILPGVISAAGMAFVISFSQYFLTFLIGGGRIITFTMLMFPFIQSGDRTMAAVYSLIFIIITWICLLIMEKGLKRFYGERDIKNKGAELPNV